MFYIEKNDKPTWIEKIIPIIKVENNTIKCPRENQCKTLPMWKKYDTMVYDFFNKITIYDLVNGNI